MNGKTLIMLQRLDGGEMFVEAAKPIEWMEGNAIPARLLVQASRTNEDADIKAKLLGAAPEADVRRYDVAPATVSAHRTSRTAPTVVSRSKSTANWNLPAHEATPIYAAYIKKINKKLTDAKAYEIAHGIIGFSLKYGVDARLIMAMIYTESTFNPNITSHAGAQGLGQLMPGTAAGMGITNAYDTMQNLYGTVRLVRGHIDKYQKSTGDDFEALVLALAAYNAGPGAVRKYNGNVPPYRETQNYVKKVIAVYRSLCGQ